MSPVRALIFDMDGTMIDSMGHHRRSWIEFARHHGLAMDIDELMRRTTGRTGAECMDELFGRAVPRDEAWALVELKERLYRELFGPEFREVAGFRAFHAHARTLGLRTGVGTAGDAANIAFNLLKTAAEGLHIGPMLLGTDLPAHVLTPSVTARGILNMTALAAVEAQRLAEARA